LLLGDERGIKITLIDYQKHNHCKFPIFTDWESKAAEAFKIPNVPSIYIIDNTGNIRFEKTGYNGNIDDTVMQIEVMLNMI